MLGALQGLAAEAGLRVRPGPPAAGEGPLESGVCRVRGELWVVLVPSDPVEHRIAVLARALVAHAPALLETRWLAPAVRERLDAARD